MARKTTTNPVKSSRPSRAKADAAMTSGALDDRRAESEVARPTLSSFRGCLLGGGLGDALGYPIEFAKRDEIERKWGAKPPKMLNFARTAEVAHISDDTQMTLFTAEGLLRARRRQEDRGICHMPTVVAFALLRWYETQGGRPIGFGDRGWLVEEKRLQSSRAPGNTCMAALKALGARDPGSSIPTIEKPANDSKGCGAVMRAAPCGLVARTRNAAFEIARDTGVITHGHPSGYLSGAYLAALVWDLTRGNTLVDAMTEADRLLATQRGADELQRVLDRARKFASKGAPNAKTIEGLGGGWTGEEALAIALLCALTHERYEATATLWRAAAHSGDSDSTAAITGNLLGAMGGLNELPPSWLKVLELRDVIDRIATDLYAVFELGESLHDYPPN